MKMCSIFRSPWIKMPCWKWVLRCSTIAPRHSF